MTEPEVEAFLKSPPDSFGADLILKAGQHAFPFTMVDRVLEWEKDKSIAAIKNVSCNEPYMPGHFPGNPIMPGVLIIEALAQAYGVLLTVSRGERFGGLFLAGIDKVRYRRMVVPGDCLRLEVAHQRKIGGMYKAAAVASVDGEVAAEAGLMLFGADDAAAAGDG